MTVTPLPARPDRQTLSLASLGEPDEPRSLPVPLTSFVGREREVAALGVLLRDPAARLVTLTGVGGVGKTRLALQVASDLASERHFAEEVAFVDLASTRDSDLVIPAIAQALNVRVGQEAAESALKSLLRSRHLLLILDNFEQVGEAGAALIDLLHACPDLHILVTSRSLLNLTGERVMPVPPLRVGSGEIGESASRQLGKNEPSSDSRLPTPVLHPLSSEAVRLFVERTRAVNPDFALSVANEPVIAEIVQRLDGLPLAIELAAARGALLSPSDLLARLAHPLPQLTAGPRDRPERHQTMHAAIAWNYACSPQRSNGSFAALASSPAVAPSMRRG